MESESEIDNHSANEKCNENACKSRSKITKSPPEFYNDKYLRKNIIDYRYYQENILKKCKNKNTLVVLPTGLGKTIIGILLIAKRLEKYAARGKILILAPTRPLVSQHLESCQKFLKINKNKIKLLTGRIPPEKRIIHFKKAQIIIATPQVIKNDVIRGRYSLKDVILAIFDEAHRARGRYSYVFLSKEYVEKCSDPLILGLTASPGKNYEIVQELCDTLYIENVVFKTYEDHDVKQYVYDIDLYLKKIDLPVRLLEISKIIENLFQQFLNFFIERELINPCKKYYSKMNFLRIAQDLTYSLKYGDLFNNENCKEDLLCELHFSNPPIIDLVKERKLNIHAIFSYCSSCISLLHAKELLETQHLKVFKTFLEKIEFKAEQGNHSAKRIIRSDHFKLIRTLIEKQEGLERLRVGHPKIESILKIIRDEISEFHNKKMLIFTQYREMAHILKTIINQEFEDDIVAQKFIGQSTTRQERGFSQHEQIEILKDFRNNNINILTATSVAEEGLDIPNVDAIIFYEPVASEIRHIQRRGRTGRHSRGRCYILIAKDSVDVPFFNIAKRKEGKMNSILMDSSQLDLVNNIDRQEICFTPVSEVKSDYEILKNYRSRRKKEKELLANRSIDEIIQKLDEFSNSEEYKKFQNYGVTFLSDMIDVKKESLKKKVVHMKGKKSVKKSKNKYQKKNKKRCTEKKMEKKKSRKQYLNNNVKTIIKLADTYSENDEIAFDKLKELAEFEEIEGRKFYIHLNRACYLKYIKRDKSKNCIYFLKHYK
jgi:Fanconi anemia group M protein